VLLVATGWDRFPPTLSWTDLQLAPPKTVATLQAQPMVPAVCLDPTGERIYLACGDGSVLVYSAAGALLHKAVAPTGNGVIGIGMSPNGSLLATGGADRTVRLYDVLADGHLRRRGGEMHGHQGDVGRVRFAPDGRSFATSSRDRTARLWSIDGTLLDTIRGHEGFVYDACFAPDGRSLVTAGSEGLARLWLTRPADLLAAAQDHIHRDLDGEELQRYGHLLQPAER
jgi:WD40 repeat protein